MSVRVDVKEKSDKAVQLLRTRSIDGGCGA